MSNLKGMGLLMVAVLFLAGLSAQETSFKPYFYLGAGGGISNFSDFVSCGNCGDSRADFTHRDDEGRSVSGFAGYRFHKYLAVELSAYNLGSANFSVVEDQPDSQLRNITFLSTSSRGIDASLKGILPISRKVELFGKAGWHYYDLDARISITNPPDVLFNTRKFGWTSSDFSYGGGIDVHLGKSWSVGAAAEIYVGDTGGFRDASLEEDDLLDPRNNYNFDLSHVQAYFAYRF